MTPLGHKPRIWPALLAPLAALAAATTLQIVAVVALMAIEAARGRLTPADLASDKSAELVEGVIGTPAGLLALMVAGQVGFGACALMAARLSRQPFADRLALRRPRRGFPALAWVLAIPGTFAASMVGGFVAEWLFPGSLEKIGPVETVARTMREAPAAWKAATVVSLSLLPGLVEEMLFRGYVQSRLLRRWPAWAAIGVTSLWFGVAHGHPVYALAVFPIGAWLGYIAWRAGSIWPACLCHAAVNALALALGVTEPKDNPYGWWIAGAAAAGAVAAVVVIEWSRRREP